MSNISIKVVIADDSFLIRQVLSDEMKKTGVIQVVGQAKNGQEAVDMVKTLKPDILVLDCEMPVMNGLEALRKIMSECPLPVFMFSSLTSEGAAVTIKALEYGAVDYLLKPLAGEMALRDVVEDLVEKLRFIFLRHKFSQMRPEKKAPLSSNDRKNSLQSIKSRKIDLITLGSSTGGVQAAMAVIPKLPKDCRPILWVQHMPGGFTKSFAERLNGCSQMKVKEAQDGDLIENGVCYLGPGGFQMRIAKASGGYRIKIGEDKKIYGHCPSCNALCESVAEYFGVNSLGVILTGMGEDGTIGLVKMHSKGAYVIGQDEASSIVYGMPKAAYDAKAVDVQLDLNDVAEGMARAQGIHK